ncbi:hypothetical protein RNJ44_01392 [Nakaseomyces bracarensis]|uniref:Uncharacterized protein n=1 Tax=Nakaseomyces bracarensis TaxID=273131 RepID=A0ABR4NPK2_9SACH
MAQAYRILGRNVQPHILAIATLATVGGVAAYFSTGEKKKETPVSTGGDDIDVEALLKSLVDEKK